MPDKRMVLFDTQVLCQQRTPDSDDERMSYRRGADSAGFHIRSSVKPPGHGGDDSEFPVGISRREPEVEKAERARCEYQSSPLASGPIRQPSLEQASRQEFLRQSDHPEKAQEQQRR